MEGDSALTFGNVENGTLDNVPAPDPGSLLPSQPSNSLNSQTPQIGSNITNTLPSLVTPSEPLEVLNPTQLTANAQANIPPLMSVNSSLPTVVPNPPPPVTMASSHPPAAASPESMPQAEATTSEYTTDSMDVESAPPTSSTADVISAEGGVDRTAGPGENTAMFLGKPKVSQGKVMEEEDFSQVSVASDDGETENNDGGFQKKVPILRLKKKLLRNDEDATFERQEISKNDSYCWVCHDGGDVLCCDKCPRVFHYQCSGLSKAPEGDEEWFCPVCKNIARKTKRSRPPHLKELLLLAVGRMMFPGTEIFQSPVPADIMIHYREYIFHPLDMGTIKQKVTAGVYQSTREFTHDTEWILHNCIIYNGGKHALTKIAKGIIKVCKEDMREIELCPGCYKLTVKQPKDWFCAPCNPPHPVVLAKVRGYPLWPAKLISETADKCDVRFFGQHDRSLVPKSCISELVGLPPKPSTKTQHWNIAMFELKKYGENIEAMRSQMGGGKLPGKSIQVTKQLDPKTMSTDPNHLGNSISNHLPASPAVVEVSPMHSDRSNIANISEPSSPDTPPGLQIVLEDSTQVSKHQSPNKGLGTLNSIERNSQVSGSLDFSTDTGPQTVTNNALPSPTAGLSKLKSRNKGDMLSKVVSTLTERQRIGVVTPGSSAPVVVTSSGMMTSLDSVEPETISREESQSGTPAIEINPAFSSIYADRNKTAVYEVDLSGKRDRKRKHPGSETSRPQSKKPAKSKSSPSKSASLNDSLSDSPQIHVATSEIVKLSSRAGAGDRVPSSVSPQPHVIVPGSNGQTHVTTTPLPGNSLIVGPKTPSKSHRNPNKKSKQRSNKRSKGASVAGKASQSQPASHIPPAIAPSPSLISQEQNTQPVRPTPTKSSSLAAAVEGTPNAGGSEVDVSQGGSGLLADTIRKVDSSFHARLNQMAGSGSEDMGYQYFMEKLMSSVKTVLIEMLSTFDAKSRLSAKQLKDQLHTCWPVPNSRVALDQLQKELRDEMKQSLEVVRASAALELGGVVKEVRRQVEKEKEIAISETKKKKWCAYCFNEAQYNCCWNANYCNETCQQSHWPEHMKECTQAQQPPRTPGLPQNEIPLPVSASSTATPQASSTSHASNSNSGTNLEPSAPSSGQQQQGGFMFVNSSAAAMAAAVQAHAQAQRQQQQQQQQGQSIIAGMAGTSPALPQQQALSSGPGNVGSLHLQKQRLTQESPLNHASHPHTSHSSAPGAESVVQQQQHGIDHSLPQDNTGSRMEHPVPENILNTTAAASPPNHIRSLFLSQNQQAQQQARLNTASPGLGLVGGHQGPATPGNPMHHGVASTAIGISDNSSMNTASHHSHQNSDHSHSSNSSGLLHAQSPISPAISHSETQPTVHNYSWPPYQQQLIIGNEGYRHALLPAMQVNTSSSPNQTYYRAAY